MHAKEVEVLEEVETGKNDNPNWQFVGKLKDVSIVNNGSQVISWIKTTTSFFAVNGLITEPLHAGQTVKLSKRDNAVKIGSILLHRPNEGNE
jgi:hypothetical protein